MWIMKDFLLDHLLVPIELDHLLFEYDLIYYEFAFIRVCIWIWLYEAKRRRPAPPSKIDQNIELIN